MNTPDQNKPSEVTAPARRPYEKPSFRHERVFETRALSHTTLQPHTGIMPQQQKEILGLLAAMAAVRQTHNALCAVKVPLPTKTYGRRPPSSTTGRGRFQNSTAAEK